MREVEKRFGPVRWKVSEATRARFGYLAGDDDVRARDFARAFASAEVVWAARGGYGAARILPRVDWKRAARSGAVLIGYSDATALLAAYDAAGGTAVWGPMLAADLSRKRVPRRTWYSLKAFLTRGPDRFSFGGHFLAGGGPVEGRILAANLEVLRTLLRTPWEPSARGRVVFLEEVAEEPYRIDRALTHLLQAGFFRGARAVVFGRFARCRAENPAKSLPLARVLDRFAKAVGLPVVAGFPFGHGGANTTLPWNGQVRIERAGEKTLRAEVAPRSRPRVGP